MAFQTKRIYRPVNGQELKDIIPARVREAMLLDNTVNITRGFPLLKYEVKITLTPYRSAGMTREGIPVDLPDTSIVYEVAGEYFTPFEPAAVELVEESPLYGREADPQGLRTLAGLGTIESVRTSTGELVDVRTKPGSKEPDVPPPLVTIPDAPPVPPPPPLLQSEVTTAQQVAPNEDPDTTYKIEESRWAGSHEDPAIARAVKAALDDPSAALKSAPGRVSIVGEGGTRRRGR
jgi:hypothetical protein